MRRANLCASDRSAAAAVTTISFSLSAAKRFRPPASPSASRASIRPCSSLASLQRAAHHGPVVVLVLDRARIPAYQSMVTELRNAGIPAELYLGTSGLKAQMKYADKRGASLAVIEGDEERARGEVQIKDLAAGALAAEAIASREAWRQARPAQFSVPRTDLVKAVKRWREQNRA